nr:hypothetical protein BaRGS_006559 [Batillaria attramentaria]
MIILVFGAVTVILPQQAVCAPTNVTPLPATGDEETGYATHMVGKWHLGFCSWNCTPTFSRAVSGVLSEYYYDFRDNKTLSVKQNGTYSTYVFQERVRQIISSHNPATPLFLYLPLQSVHAPLEVPKQYSDMYPNLKTNDRRVFSGMVTAMDDVIGNLTSFLTDRGMYDDTLFFLTADNGGWVQFAEVIYNLDDMMIPGEGHAAIRQGDYKLIVGLPGIYSDWYPPDKPMAEEEMRQAMDTIVQSALIPVRSDGAGRPVGGWDDVRRLYNVKDTSVLAEDPTEHNDIAEQNPDIVEKLVQRMAEYKKKYVPPNYPHGDPASNPQKYGGAWTPGWC